MKNLSIALMSVVVIAGFSSPSFAGDGLEFRANLKEEVVAENPETVKPAAPEIEVSMVETSCEAVHYDRCGTFEIGCDGKEFSDGALLVKDDGSKTYKMRVTARNAYMVWDSCGLFSAFPSQGGEFEKVVEWSWNGPYAYARESSVDHRRQPKTHWESNDPWYQVGGGSSTSYVYRQSGSFDCKAYALGKNFQIQEIAFSYSCTEDGGDGSTP